MFYPSYAISRVVRAKWWVPFELAGLEVKRDQNEIPEANSGGSVWLGDSWIGLGISDLALEGAERGEIILYTMPHGSKESSKALAATVERSLLASGATRVGGKWQSCAMLFRCPRSVVFEAAHGRIDGLHLTVLSSAESGTLSHRLAPDYVGVLQIDRQRVSTYGGFALDPVSSKPTGYLGLDVTHRHMRKGSTADTQLTQVSSYLQAIGATSIQ